MRAKVLLSLQRALLGAISKNIRAITCAWSDSTIVIRSFHDGKVSNEDKDAMEIAGSEVAADLPNHRVEVECVRVDYPKKPVVSENEIWVYQRKET